MRKSLLVLGLIFAAPGWATEKPERGPVGAWVEPFPEGKAKSAATDGSGALPADAPIALLRLDQQVRFGKDDDERYIDTMVKVLTPQGLTAMGTLTISWQPQWVTPIVHKVQITRGDQVIDVLAGGKEFTILRRESRLESAALDGLLTATIQPEGLQVGDIIELAVTLKGRDPVLPSHAEFAADLPQRLPGTRVHFALSWPAGMTMNWRKSDPVPAAKVRQDKDGNRVSFTLDSIQPLVAPKDAPTRFAPVRRLEFTNFGSWADLSAAMVPLYQKATVIPAGSSLAAEVEKIRAASPDAKLRATAALKLVQDQVRYLYLGMNQGNLMPASAADTWDRRYGDCKAKTALLIAILSALDIAAEPAAVSTVNGDGLDARLPVVALLDHILVHAEIGGQTYWLDGTRLGDGNIDRIVVPPFRWALPIHAGGGALMPLVQKPADKPLSETAVWIDASKGISLPAPIEMTTILRGDDALQLRQQLSTLAGKELDDGLRKYWKGRFSFVTPEHVAASYDEKLGEEKLTLGGQADLGWDDDGYELDGASLGWSSDSKREPGPNADAPVSLGFPYYDTNKETILLPYAGRGFTVDGADIERELAGYAFRRHTRIQDGQLVMESSTRSLKPEIPYAEALASDDAMKAIDKVRVFVHQPKDYQVTGAERAAVIAKVPKTSDDFLARGNRYMEDGDLDKAIADMSQAIALNADNGWAYANRGLGRAWKGEPEKAADDLDKAAAINPRIYVIYHARAKLLEDSGEIGAAIAALSRAIDLKAGNLWAVQRRAGLYLMRKDYPSALADIDTVLKMSPNNLEGLFLKSRVERISGKYAEALATLDILEKQPSNEIDVSAQRAYVNVLMGKPSEATSLFAKVRGKATKNAALLNELCWTEAQAAFELDKALADCDAALKLKPDASAYLDSAGLVLLRLGRFDDAVARYDRALAKAPKQSASLYGRGIAKLRKGDTAAGNADVAAALKISASIASEFEEFGVKP